MNTQNLDELLSNLSDLSNCIARINDITLFRDRQRNVSYLSVINDRLSSCSVRVKNDMLAEAIKNVNREKRANTEAAA